MRGPDFGLGPSAFYEGPGDGFSLTKGLTMRYLVMYKDVLGRFPVLSNDVSTIEQAQELCRKLKTEGNTPLKISSVQDDGNFPIILNWAAKPCTLD